MQTETSAHRAARRRRRGDVGPSRRGRGRPAARRYRRGAGAEGAGADPRRNDELERLMALPLKHQEVALRALLYYAGLREAEVCGLRLCDLTPPIDATSEEPCYCVGYVHVL